MKAIDANEAFQRCPYVAWLRTPLAPSKRGGHCLPVVDGARIGDRSGSGPTPEGHAL
jgi:hypothetical protein